MITMIDNGIPRAAYSDPLCCPKKIGIQRPTSSNLVCCPSAIIACHARCRLTVCAAQGP